MDDSIRFLRNSKKFIPGECSTEGKRIQSLFASDWGPFFFRSANGVELTDLDGNCYIDFSMGFGSCLLGYNHPVVVEAVQSELKNGIISTLSSSLEPRLAELIVDMIPSVEQVRFLKTGAEACSAAIRLARAYTYREFVLASGYFGWHDWSNKDAGVPISTRNLCLEFLFNDSSDFLEKFNNLPEYPAAVIIEPVMEGPPDRDFLKTVRDICTKCGIVLIFDEIKTGARLAPGGAQEYYGFTPDLTVLGKGLAGGMPLAAVGGKKEILDTWRKLWISSTLAGESLSLAAALATLQFIRDNPVSEHIHKVGTELLKGFQRLTVEFPDICEYSGIPHMNKVGLKAVLPNLKSFEAEYYQEILRAGFIITHNGYNYPSYAHTEGHIKDCLEVLRRTFEWIQRRI
jgi:glutamate-1-semialdehyde 2,1-aminomutase